MFSGRLSSLNSRASEALARLDDVIGMHRPCYTLHRLCTKSRAPVGAAGNNYNGLGKGSDAWWRKQNVREED
jgi:hypothetical protein